MPHQPTMLLALRNNALWLLLMVPGTIAGGLFFALLADRVRYESAAKAIIFLPTAISFIGAGIIWRSFTMSRAAEVHRSGY